MSPLKLYRQELCDFLVLAKQNTFAKDVPKAESKCLLSKNYVFEVSGFRYEDQYFGEHIDVGQEIVWYQSIPVWGMGYRGGIRQEFMAERDEAFKFLRKALMTPESSFPIRGPKHFQNGSYLYNNLPEGSILNFTGRETISRGGIEICFRQYVGGLIYGKRNADMFVS